MSGVSAGRNALRSRSRAFAGNTSRYLHFDEVTSPGRDFPTLREREHDLILARIARPLVDEEDWTLKSVPRQPDHCRRPAQRMGPSPENRRCRTRRRILDSDGTSYVRLPQRRGGFRDRGLGCRRSVSWRFRHLRMVLVSRGPFVTALPSSLLRFNAPGWLKVLPVDLQIRDTRSRS